ncbi:MAG: hypothetical protein WD989_02350 [Candidatus Paceibacterota bacterium]
MIGVSSKNRILLENNLREKALKLRSQGFSYKEILQKVPVAKSTISLWCRGVKMTSEQEKRLKEKSRKRGIEGIKAIQTMFWRKRCEAFLEGVALIKKFEKDPEFLAGLMLYWAEGTKKSSTAVTNSDPRVIKFIVKWLKKFFNINSEQLSIEIHIHPDQDQVKIKGYWQNLTSIPSDNFRKIFVKARGSGYRKNRLENGIAKIIVKTQGSTYLLFKILGAINGYLNLTIDEHIEPKNWMSVPIYAKEKISKKHNTRP